MYRILKYYWVAGFIYKSLKNKNDKVDFFFKVLSSSNYDE